MQIHQWLKVLADRKGSDLYLATGAPPCAKFEGELKTISSDVLSPGEVAEIANELMYDTQREVGIDTRNWQNALKNTLRQAPDVILIGEIRDRETMEHAISFAETGHLCISTLHANNANQVLDRIINFFPEEKRQQLLMDLSLNLQAFVSQRLIPNKEGGRSAAVEVMLGSPTVKELILRGDIGGLKEIMEKSKDRGMKTSDMGPFDLCQAGEITEEEALRNADSENNLRLRLKLTGGQVA
jgi:twitching motility protein PilU